MVDDVAKYPLTGRFLMGRSRHALGEREKELLELSIEQVIAYDRPTRILARGALADRSTMLIEGFILRTIEENNRRYVVGIQVPGDFVDLHAYALKRLDHDVVTIGPAKVGHVSHDRIGHIHQTVPHLSRLFWFSTLLDAAIHRQWTLKLEQLKASRRVAHRIAEIWTRLEMVGLGRPSGFRSPLTQTDLADMCGTTPIHMNRALAEMRREEVMEFRRGLVVVRDRAKLERYGDFDPAYLYGDGPLHVEHELDDVV
ncbi:transcriptional regulator FixK [Tsuneonella dongtanensis]|uniref:Transcriptional regulator FixK n=1 Tax=Tsuneonella dongtanensis TaxID=692370 RepID=A0A1B2ABM7_9SPHN|nr:Crp/Fnr family transcriptional regulator [Tsuneonella dongtanensis]ANY19511.1 transcriptional regulator FixK [Tsuneonella dongtanensis]